MTKASSKKSADDKNDEASPQKKGKDIKPLHEDALKKQQKSDVEAAQANADVLAELAAKTAELAGQVKGHEDPEVRILNLEEPGDIEPKDIFAELDKPTTPNEVPKVAKAATKPDTGANPAAALIREKLDKLYRTEPNAEAEAVSSMSKKTRSKHQQFMYDLTTSGKSLADIQTEWHNYYVALPNDEKHSVWQEFYKDQHAVSSLAKHQRGGANPETKSEAKKQPAKQSTAPSKRNSAGTVKSQILNKVNADGKLKPIHHVKSALFGVGMAAIVGLAMTFVFFNEVFVAPFISPSKTVSATPIIGDIDGPVGPEPKIIIPKINLEVPVVFGMNTIEESAIQDALEDGVVQYASSPEPGEQGNSVIVGHSSNNILNSGKYKFAFVLLNRLEIDDTFFVHKDGVRYTYKIFERKIVPPTDVSVLGPSSRDNTMTLITCDPPGTSINRLIVIAEQISPDPAENTVATIDVDPALATIPSNAPSLWSRLWPF